MRLLALVGLPRMTLLGFVVATLCLAAPLLRAPDAWGILDWDQHTFHHAVAREALLAEGDFPLWNPYYRSGVPLLANPESRVLAPSFPIVLGFGAAGLAISLAGAWWFTRQPGRSRIGAIVYGALSVPTLLLFFSGTPAMFGVTAAFLAGLTRGRQPETGAPRVFGTVGLVLAVVNVCVTILGVTIAWLTD